VRRKRGHVAAAVEQHRRVVDFLEQRRVVGLVPGQQPATVLADLLQLLLGGFEGGAGNDAMRHWRGQAAAFKLGERGREDTLGRAEALQELGGQTGAHAGGEQHRQPIGVAFERLSHRAQSKVKRN